MSRSRNLPVAKARQNDRFMRDNDVLAASAGGLSRMPSVAPLSAPVLIGREDEFAALEKCLEGGRGAVLISGEAGVGKSRLAREAAKHAAARGYGVLRAACFERDQVLAYAPWLDLLRTYAATNLEGARDRLRTSAPRFLRLAPDLAGVATVSDALLEQEPEQHRLVQEMRAFLSDLAAARPLVLVVEDLHWSDEASLDLLLHLIRRTPAAPLVLLLTYRSNERPAMLSRFLAEIDRERTVSEISLGPLTPSQVEQLLRALLDLPRPASAVFVRALHSLTGGNPFFVEEVVRSLVAEGGIFPSQEGWQRKPLDQLRVPRSIEDAVQRRSALLSPTAHEALTLAAVMGRRFDFTLLHALSLVAAIKELIAAQLLDEVSADVFAFRHALTRQAVYANLLARERRALHARIACAIEGEPSTSWEAALDDLAYHHFAAEHWEQAADLARAAGDRALALYAPQAAAEHYTRALDATARLGVAPDAALLRARGQAFDAIGDFAAAQSDYVAALLTAEADGDRASALAALLDLGLLWSSRDYEQAHTWLLRAIDTARAMDDPAALAHALNRLGNWHANREEIDQALRYRQEALAIFTLLAEPRGLAQTLDLLAMTHGLGGDALAAQEAAARAVSIFTELGDRHGLAGVLPMTAPPSLGFEFMTMVGGATIATASETLERALAMTREIDLRAGEAHLLALLGETWASAGEFGKALAVLHESITIARELDHRQWMVQARWALARLYGMMLLPEQERDELEGVLALSRQIHSRVWIRLASGGLALALLTLGDAPAARAVLSEALPDETPMRAQGERLLWLAQADLALATGEPQEPLAIVDRLYATARNLAAEGEIARLAQLKAIALTTLGEHERAEALLGEAQEAARMQGVLPTLPPGLVQLKG